MNNLITDLNIREYKEVFGGETNTATCKWEKTTHSAGGYVIGSLLGVIAGGLGYATGLSGFGTRFQNNPRVHGFAAVLSAVVMGGIGAAAVHTTNEDCYPTTVIRIALAPKFALNKF